MKAKATILIMFLFIGASLPAFAQATAYANIYVTVVAPAGISNTSDNNFGSIVIPKKNSSVSINSNNELTASGVKLTQTGAATLASFSVADSDNTTFDVTLPSENMMIGEGNSTTMEISNFSCTHSLTSSLEGNMREIRVGASLHFSEDLTIKNNNSQNRFPVTLNYN